MLKDFITKKSINLVKSNFPDFDQDKIDKIQYGLEAIYLSITKVVVILLAAVFLNIIKETLILLLLFNALRMTGFGLHAPKSWMCWISSSLIFIGFPYLCKIIELPKIIMLCIAMICVVLLSIYAPADTEKRPLIRKKRRIIYKIITIILSIIYSILIFYIDNNFTKNALLLALIVESTMVLPISYKILNLPYRNYKNY